MRVIVTGSRDWTDLPLLRRTLDDFGPIDTLVHGGARGADQMAHIYGQDRRLVVEEFPAAWDTLGKVAGLIRNQHMVDRGADLCVAFPTPSSKGTWDCIRRAAAAGIPVFIQPPITST